MLAVVGVIALAVLASLVALWPRGELPKPAAGGQADSTRLVSATLTKVTRVDCPEADPGVPGSVCIKVTAQPASGHQVSFDTTDPTGGMFRAGQRVRLLAVEADNLGQGGRDEPRRVGLASRCRQGQLAPAAIGPPHRPAWPDSDPPVSASVHATIQVGAHASQPIGPARPRRHPLVVIVIITD